MASKYTPQDIESKWIDEWESKKIYKTPKLTDKKEKMYVLDMFPYPSSVGLHVGHPRGYTATDILARFYRMNGFSVLHPMGWDAFGLPAENAAIQAKKNPQDMVPTNIANFKQQMKMLGLSYDWDREFATTDPSYYKWTQWLFIQFFKIGLLYKKNTPVYYCQFCKTGLAEEEVLPNGTHERCGNPITRRVMPQWVFRITEYADKLLEGLNDLKWPEGIIQMQKNWIGRSEGVEIRFKMKDLRFKNNEIQVFTTRPDTIYGVTALVLAPEHPLVEEILQSKEASDKNRKEIESYVSQAQSKSDLARTDLAKEKKGVNTFTSVVNPVSGEEILIWIADYVLGFYGSGAVMLVPAHDQRDFEFAKKYGIKIKSVITGPKPTVSCHGGEGKMINSGEYNGMTSQEFRKKITEVLEKKKAGKKSVQYKLRDWIFSRQRYWGEPIPMVFCEKCAKNKISYWDSKNRDLRFKIEESILKSRFLDHKSELYGWFPVDEKDLPLELPYLKSYELAENGKSPLENDPKWREGKCPNCGEAAYRETDTMPNWAGSCWYFLRFTDPHNDKEAWSKEAIKTFMPVDWYMGGAEHAVLHLLYSRFWVKALYDLGLVDFTEPFLRLRNVGMVLAKDHKKMSKSLGNVINPDEVVKEFGADSLRIYEMFMAPFSQEIAWSTQTLQGSYRFLKRIWQIYSDSTKLTNTGKTDNKEIVAKLQSTISKVSSDITNTKFNTAIAFMMEFLNEWEKEGITLSKDDAKSYLKILAPFAPFITEEIWRKIFNEQNSIHLSDWPKTTKIDKTDQAIRIPVQTNGKLRAVLVVSGKDLDEKNLVKKALELESVTKHLANKKYKIIYKRGKILNFVFSQ